MSGIQSQIMNINIDTEGTTSFRTRTPPPKRCLNIPRRYALAVMCNLAFFLRTWMIANLSMIFYHVITLEESERELHLPSIANFTEKETKDMHKTYDSAFIIGQIPAAMLIIKFSPYQIMQYSMILSSFLQLITPWTMQISATLFFANVLMQGLCASPLDCACIGLIREWAPPTEKTRLLMISFSGRYMYYQIAFPLCLFLSETVSPVSLHYFAGIAGVIWCILWINVISGSPSDDLLISEAELQYLEEQVPSQNKEKITLSSVPVKSILLSLPVLALCLVFISSAFSSSSMVYYYGVIQMNLILAGYNVDWMVWVSILNSLLLVPLAGFLTDILINRKIMETTTIRKILCSAGLILHALFLLLFIIPDLITASVCLKISLLLFPFTLAGVLPNVLDLSPRYACAIMGVTTTVYSISRMLCDLMMDMLIVNWTISELIESFISVELLAVLAAIVFAILGSGEEQEWSKCSPSAERPSAERPEETYSQCYPQSNLEDEMLITGGL